MTDKRLREALVEALNLARLFDPAAISPKTAGQVLERWDELVNEGGRLRLALSEHHAVGVQVETDMVDIDGKPIMFNVHHD